MTAEQKLEAAARARVNKAIKNAKIVLAALGAQRRTFDGERMQHLRDHVEDLAQCVHEFNAYHNAAAYHRDEDALG